MEEKQRKAKLAKEKAEKEKEERKKKRQLAVDIDAGSRVHIHSLFWQKAYPYNVFLPAILLLKHPNWINTTFNQISSSIHICACVMFDDF